MRQSDSVMITEGVSNIKVAVKYNTVAVPLDVEDLFLLATFIYHSCVIC